MLAILAKLGEMLVEYLIADDFANAKKLAAGSRDILHDRQRSPEAKLEAMRGLMSGMARDRASAATTLAEKKKRTPAD